MSVEELEAGLLRFLAPNPSPLTAEGTNTYVLLGEACTLIDPGPIIESHKDAIIEALDGRTLEAILVTHSHRDHSPLARPLAELTGAKVYAFGATGTGRSAIMEDLAAQSSLGGGEGADPDFAPDILLTHGESIETPAGAITALHTPGHFGNHLCFAWNDALFSGDHVMGWASTLVSPPDGDLTDFMRSCRLLVERGDRIYYPGHGDPITSPKDRVEWLIKHRLSRERQVLDALKTASATARDLTATIYLDVEKHLWPAAERNVLAHLIDLTSRGLVAPESTLSRASKFKLI
ncbi:MAG: MBL fold metallo-hydrolase [Pseudomonadota bacterium]